MSENKAGVYGTIVIVGGGCYGTYYLTQLRRARAAGALTFDRLIVVDRDAACQRQIGLEGDQALAGQMDSDERGGTKGLHGNAWSLEVKFVGDRRCERVAFVADR